MRVVLTAAFCLTVLTVLAQQADPIETVEIGEHAELRVNGEPFFPLMSWLQGTKRFPQLRSVGINTFVGNHKNQPAANEFCDAARAAGGYGIPHFDPTGKGHAHLLAYIHADEPDISSPASRAKVTPGQGLRINRKAPLGRIFDGVTHSWSVLDPLENASFTLELPEPVALQSLAAWVTVSKGLALPKEMVFLGDGKELLRTAVMGKKGRQKFDLPAPATFSTLTVQIPAVVPGDNVWGSLSELEGLDADGKNVLLSPPYQKLRMTPDEVMTHYREIKAADPTRPVFMTLTGRFLEQFTRFTEENRLKYYPEFVKGTDVVGFDIYPIFGWAKPEWMFQVAEGTKELVRLAGPQKPVYAWIETHKGTKNITYENQKDVLPKHTRAEVWMAIIQGARGIGYFTHAWRPSFTEFSPTAEMQKELTRLNAQITRLAPAILAPASTRKVNITFPDGVPGHAKATELDGKLYVFAQNMDMQGRAGEGTITVPGLRVGTTVEVVDEGRTLKALNGSFSDTFDALQEHVYRVTVR